MKNLSKLFFVFFIAHFIACSNDAIEEMSVITEDVNNNGTVENTFKVSEDEAKETLISFLGQFESNSSVVVRSTSQRTIKDIQAFNVNPTTRSSSDYDYEIPDDVETLFYLINFNNDQGFGIVSGDKRTTPVLAVIDEGSLSLDTLSRVKNIGFLMSLDQAVAMQLEEIHMYDDHDGDGSSGYSPNSSTTVLLDVPIRLKTRWGQKAPYNKYAPNGTTGCVMVAAAQALSYFQTIGSVQWQYNNTYGSSVLNWSQIIANSEDYLRGYGMLHTTASEHAYSANQVSHLMRFLGVSVNANYKSNGQTGADTGDAIKHLKNWCGLSSSTGLYNYDATGVRNALSQNSNSLVIVESYANRTNKFLGMVYKYKDGHAWIIDGARRIQYSTSNIKDYVHCNWGWNSSCDGYFISGSFNTQVPPEILDPNDGGGTDAYNFRYKTNYAVLKR